MRAGKIHFNVAVNERSNSFVRRPFFFLLSNRNAYHAALHRGIAITSGRPLGEGV